MTEPVPDVLDELGWRGGESISDGRALLHYCARRATTGSCSAGRAAGWRRARARAGGWRSTRRSSTGAHVARALVPAARGAGDRHAWGGPIDVSPTHRPAIVGLRSVPAWAAFGFTGNGVGPSHLFGRTLAALALDRRDPVTRLPFVDPAPRQVPPEPLAWRAPP